MGPSCTEVQEQGASSWDHSTVTVRAGGEDAAPIRFASFTALQELSISLPCRGSAVQEERCRGKDACRQVEEEATFKREREWGFLLLEVSKP